jgi:hypothetical protein
MKKLLVVLIVFLMGCATPHDISLEREKVHEVTVAQVTSHASVLEEHYWKYAQHEGVHFPPSRSDINLDKPDAYNNGGDSALFTGYALATYVYKYKVTGKAEDLFSVIRSLRGVYILTHVTGTPGVIARAAFPADNPGPWRFPESWGSRIERGFVGTGPAHQLPGTDWDSYMRSYPSMTYYTRATRDQLTGLLFGLTVAWHELTDLDNDQIVAIRSVVAEVSNDLYNHLRAHDFNIRDEKGENMTNADDVTNFMKLQLLALYRFTAPENKRERIKEKYETQRRFCLNVGSLEFWNVFNNYSQYYAWNLRYARAYSVWMLEDSQRHKEKLASYIKKWLWGFTKDHDCPFFAYMYASSSEEFPTKSLNAALFNLKSLVLRPIRQEPSPLAGDTRMPNILQIIFGDDGQYHLPPHLRKPTNYFTWTKRGWDVGHPGQRLSDNASLDFLLPYWLGRRVGLVPTE